MATASIEILCSYTGVVPENLAGKQIGLAFSQPPQSDRSPSIWQNYLDDRKGMLVHVFDPVCCGQPRRWAYDILEEEEWKRFRFKSELVETVFVLIQKLLELSVSGEVVFLSDAQWSNSPKVFRRVFRLDAFKKYHDRYGIRLNSAIRITR